MLQPLNNRIFNKFEVAHLEGEKMPLVIVDAEASMAFIQANPVATLVVSATLVCIVLGSAFYKYVSDKRGEE